METLRVVRPSLFATVEQLLAAGLPVWLSFRRCRHGLCGSYGQHWGGPEGDAFGRAARRFEQLGASALLVNGIPPDHVDGIVTYLREFTDLPLGVYPNIGYCTSEGWRLEPGTDAEYAARRCTGAPRAPRSSAATAASTPEHIRAARTALAGAPAGRTPTGARPDGSPPKPRAVADKPSATSTRSPSRTCAATRRSSRPRTARCSWSGAICSRARQGRDQRCLDIGSGCGLQAIQLALNGADHVDAIDVDPRPPS